MLRRPIAYEEVGDDARAGTAEEDCDSSVTGTRALHPCRRVARAMIQGAAVAAAPTVQDWRA